MARSSSPGACGPPSRGSTLDFRPRPASRPSGNSSAPKGASSSAGTARRTGCSSPAALVPERQLQSRGRTGRRNRRSDSAGQHRTLALFGARVLPCALSSTPHPARSPEPPPHEHEPVAGLATALVPDHEEASIGREVVRGVIPRQHVGREVEEPLPGEDREVRRGARARGPQSSPPTAKRSRLRRRTAPCRPVTRWGGRPLPRRRGSSGRLRARAARRPRPAPTRRRRRPASARRARGSGSLR